MEGSECGAVGTSSVQQGSDDASNVEHCAQCQESGLSVVASTFCSDCDDFLCNGCVDQHKKLRATKKHNLLDGNVVPNVKPRVTGGRQCVEHPGETLQFYCQSDRVFGCLSCITGSHRNCPDLNSISKLSKDIEMTKELNDLKISAEKLNAEIASYKHILDEYHVLNDKWYDQSVEEFGTFRTKLESVLDAMEKEVYSQAGELKKNNNNTMKSHVELLESIEQELESLAHDIEWREKTKEMEQLFIEVKEGTRHIEDNVKKLDQIKDDMHIQRYKFKVNQGLQQMLDELTNTVCSPLKVMSGDLECTAVINIQSPDDTADCLVSGLAEISTNEMIIADYENECLKCLQLDSKTIVRRRPLKSHPYDVTFISDDAKVAVTLHKDHEIQYFTADKQIEPCGSISVDGACVAVQYSQGTLVVSFWEPSKVQIIDLEGSTLKSFITDTTGNQLFDQPNFLCFNQDRSDIIISDNEKILTCIDASNGQVSWKRTRTSLSEVDDDDGNKRDNPDDEDEDKSDRKDEAHSDEEYKDLSCDEEESGDEGFYPQGVVLRDDGCLYVCSDKTDCIHVISAAGIRLRVIPMDQINCCWPYSLCYSKDRDALYASSSSETPEHRNFIRRFSYTSS